MLFIVCVLVIFELIFKVFYWLTYQKPYKILDKVPYKNIYVESHPYLPFIYKKNFSTEIMSRADYPLHRGKYFFGAYGTNNLGFLNGLDGYRNVSFKKEKGLIKINCVGASTTGNYIIYKNKDYSYPMELEKILNYGNKGHFEVNNCGQGGYNSADILIRFSLQVVETKPDIVILYHAYNDIASYLTPNFMSDYSHCRVNIGDSLWKFRMIDSLPNIPLHFINYLFDSWFPVSVRNSLSDLISRGKIDLSLDPSEGLRVYKRNIQAFIDVCKRNEIQLILSTFCFYLHEEASNSKTHLRYQEIVNMENEIMKELAEKNKLKLVDNASLIPKEEQFFVDTIHFTPEGMNRLANNFANAI